MQSRVWDGSIPLVEQRQMAVGGGGGRLVCWRGPLLHFHTTVGDAESRAPPSENCRVLTEDLPVPLHSVMDTNGASSHSVPDRVTNKWCEVTHKWCEMVCVAFVGPSCDNFALS